MTRPLVAMVLAAVLTVTGCSAASREPARHRPATSPGAAGLALPLPPGWQVRRDAQPDSYHVVVSGSCADQGAAQYTGCRSFEVLGASYVTPNQADPSAPPIQPYQLTEPHSGQYVQDPGYDCPGHPDLRAGTTRYGASLLSQGGARVGGRAAQYREWSVPCYQRGPNVGEFAARSPIAYLERDWYVAEGSVLIVDEYQTPGLAGLLARATWH